MKTHSKKKKYIAFDRKTFKSVNIAKKLSMQPSLTKEDHTILNISKLF